MKILYLANIRLPTEKAHGVQIMKMCEAFAELGHDVMLCVPWRFNAIREDSFAYYSVQKTFSIRRIFSLDLIRLGALGFMVQTFTFAAAAAVVARFSPGRLVYTRDPWIVYFCRLVGVDVAWECHVASQSFAFKKAARYARKIIVISQGLAEFYHHAGAPKHKLYVAHDGVDLRDFEHMPSKSALRTQLSLPADKSIVAYVGKFRTMGQAKGVEEVIQMFGLLSHRPETFLLLVGLNKDEFPLARECADAAGIPAERYMLVGHVSRAQVPAYLCAADVLIMNYPNTEHYARMMSPLKLFEYMGSGVPIVSSDLPSVREVLSNRSAVLVAPDNIEALARGVEEVFNDPAAAEARTKEAREVIKQYTWKARAKMIFEKISE